MEDGTIQPTLYQILQVHEAAPLDLISAVYWRLTALAQAERRAHPEAGAALYHLTRAYETLADANSRSAYDASIGLKPQPSLPAFPRRRRGISLVTAGVMRGVDEVTELNPYEMLRLDPAADSGIVNEAYGIMRAHYTRVVRRRGDREDIIAALERARALLADPATRAEYDEKRAREQGSRADPSQDVAVAEATPADAPRNDTALVSEPLPARPKQDLTSKAVHARPARKPRSESSPPTKSPPPSDGSTNGVRGRAIIQTIARKAADRLKETLDVNEPEDRVEADDAEKLFLQRLSAVPATTRRNPRRSNGRAPTLARLVVIGGPSLNTSLEMTTNTVTIGSASSCDVRLPDLADVQARLLFHDGSFVIYILTPDVPSVIHGDAGDWAVLENGESFELGPHTLRFESLVPAPVGN